MVRDNDNSTIRIFNNPEPGVHLCCTDEASLQGMVSYSAIPYGAEGRGKGSTVSVYVGEDIPKKPLDVLFKDNLDGTASLSWNSPGNTGVTGNLVNESRLTYNLYDLDLNMIESGLTETGIKFTDMPSSSEQSIARVGVSAQTSAGEGEMAKSSEIILGTPYEFPYYESFPEGIQTHAFIGRMAGASQSSSRQPPCHLIMMADAYSGPPLTITSTSISVSASSP